MRINWLQLFRQSGEAMTITIEQNERLTRYGRGTPCGELFRRYWWPVAVVSELTGECPTKHVRIMAEDLVLFRTTSGQVGLIQDHCAHRGASLLYGRVEERGIACAYHGWLYDTEGAVLECPAEPASSQFYRTVRATAYPVREHLGLYWTYMGPAPVPLLPTCGLAPEWGVVAVEVEEGPGMHCNWLQIVENFVDGLHFPILHQELAAHRWPDAPVLTDTTRGYIDLYASNDYWEESWGIMRKATYTIETARDLTVGDSDAHIFPHIRRHRHEVIIRVPVDDTTTTNFDIYPTMDGGPDQPVEHWVNDSHIDVLKALNGRHRIDNVNLGGRMMPVPFQDRMMMEGQGPISPREKWRTATSDGGLVLLHQMLMREMEKVERGLDPIGVTRDRNDGSDPPVLWEPNGRYEGRGRKVFPTEPGPAVRT
jgi:5,5'-dehydrodivanillate O-demethylase oxygenase subunit